MKTPSWYIPRRTLLRTVGTAVALPFLETMVRPGARAAGLDQSPRRFMITCGGNIGYAGILDVEQNCMAPPWCPRTPGNGPIENNAFLKPFFDRNIQSKITLVNGLTDRNCSRTHGATPMALSGTIGYETGGRVGGASADQVAANHLRQYTDIPSLFVSFESLAGLYSMSWKSASEPIPGDLYNPRAVFNRLFASFDPTESAADAERRRRQQKSVLDGVRADAKSLEGRISRSDREKLGQYFNSVRELEIRIEKGTARQSSPVGAAPPDSGSGVYSTPEYVRTMYDLVAKAFETDRTRVVTMSGTYGGSYLRYPLPGEISKSYAEYTGEPLRPEFHEISHYNAAAITGSVAMNRLYMDVWNKFNLELYAEFLGKLDKLQDPDGATVLDNLVCYWGSEFGDSHDHGCAGLPCVLGGRGGMRNGQWAINAGRHIRMGRLVKNFYYWDIFDESNNAYGVKWWPLQPERSPLERGKLDLLWGMLNIVGVPGLTGFGAKAPAEAGGSRYFPNAPLDIELA